MVWLTQPYLSGRRNAAEREREREAEAAAAKPCKTRSEGIIQNQLMFVIVVPLRRPRPRAGKDLEKIWGFGTRGSHGSHPGT